MQAVYDSYQTAIDRKRSELERRQVRLTAIQRHMGFMEGPIVRESSGFKRIALCRTALDALDRQGWNRSFHQRQFHDQFIRASARIFWKTDPPGAFARDHQRILEANGWDTLSQEVLVSTPRRRAPPILFQEDGEGEAGDREVEPAHLRGCELLTFTRHVRSRFGKTISVSMFAAAMLYSTPNLEMSIYSTCKRISQKLLRNVYKFLELIHLELKTPKMREIRMNFEEIVLKGEESEQDVRVVNSYPSKV